jgi:hypothetical protein
MRRVELLRRYFSGEIMKHSNAEFAGVYLGDIDYRPEDVERNMENHFRLAHNWSCVLLLDEADVFLAKRDVRQSFFML